MVSSFTVQTALGGASFFFFFAEKLSENQSKDEGSCFVQVASCSGPWCTGLGRDILRNSSPGQRRNQACLCYCPFLSMTSHGFTKPPTSFSELHRTIQMLTRCPCLYSRPFRVTGSSESAYQTVENCYQHFNTRYRVWNREGGEERCLQG